MAYLKTFSAVALCVTLILSGQALAHVTVEESSIEDGASLSEAPSGFSFSFGGDVRLVGLTISGVGLDDEDLAFSPDGGFAADYEADLPDLEPGSYVIEWRAMAKDGHVMLGRISFELEG
ncbi:hypothetical protein HK107_12095 [Parvularcula sp. ZS-1/3]|uniref:CopC domain-containing protein n=1 Tax=Parvularcula mediterranea TaxID=2732508 RepID=A0A7Y3W607_9PROT|nr:hypothetical protein [Parvularcula mediterranea]